MRGGVTEKSPAQTRAAQIHSQTQAVQSQSQIGSVTPIATPTATAKAIAAMRSVMENPRQAALTLGSPVRFSGKL
jgi:hypothetical protein